jgi:hypothetical protein
MSMTPEEEAIENFENWLMGKEHWGTDGFSTVLSLARRALTQSDIGQVLDELERYLTPMHTAVVDRLRSKYCPAPKEEKPTLSDVLVPVIRALPVDVSDKVTMLARLRKYDQLKELP